MNWNELINELYKINMKIIYKERKIKNIRLIKGDTMYCLQVDFEPLDIKNDTITPFREFIKYTKEENDE